MSKLTLKDLTDHILQLHQAPEDERAKVDEDTEILLTLGDLKDKQFLQLTETGGAMRHNHVTGKEEYIRYLSFSKQDTEREKFLQFATLVLGAEQLEEMLASAKKHAQEEKEKENA